MGSKSRERRGVGMLELTIKKVQERMVPYRLSIRKEGVWWAVGIRGVSYLYDRRLDNGVRRLLFRLGYRRG
jgi:hypothetical protein